MNINKSTFEKNDRDLNFDFDEWAALYKADPEAFESRRKMWNDQLIKKAPAPYQRRLSGLLFQIDMEKKRSKNAMDSCIRISALMWDKFHELKNELQAIIEEPGAPSPNSLSRNARDNAEKIELLQADIIDFERYKKELI